MGAPFCLVETELYFRFANAPKLDLIPTSGYISVGVTEWLKVGYTNGLRFADLRGFESLP
jgi:hypothetical protein